MKIRAVLASLLVMLMLVGPAYSLDVVGRPEAIPGFEVDPSADIDCTRSFVNILVQGTGLGLYPDIAGKPKYGIGVFRQQGSGFVVGNYIITAAHVVNPTSVQIRTEDGSLFMGPIIHVRDIMIWISGSPARIFHIDVAEDYAVLVFDGPCSWVESVKMAITETFDWFVSIFGFYSVDKLHPGDEVYAVVRVRDDNGGMTSMGHLVKGKILSGKPILPAGYEDSLPWFGLSDFTTDLPIIPGDSGSAVIGFINGVPYVIGIARAAGRIGDQQYTYAVRIDFVLLITEAR